MAGRAQLRDEHYVESHGQPGKLRPRQKKRGGARAMRRRCRGETEETASAAVARAFTSMIASTLPRRAMMSISPAGQRQSRATIRHKRSRK